MRGIAIFLLVIDVVMMFCCIMEVCDADSETSRRSGMAAWCMAAIVGIFLALIAKFC